MKNFIFIFSLLFLFSCASDLEENVKLDSDQKIETLTIDDFNFKNEYVYISHMNSLTKKKGLKGKIDFEDVDYQFYSVIKTDKELPLNIKSEIEFENFIKKSNQRYVIHYFINDLLDVSYYYNGDKLEFEVVNKDFSAGRLEPYPRKSECSLEGLRQCANYRLYTSGLVSKIVCSFTFYIYCYPILYADCLVANCTDLDKTVELVNIYEDDILYEKNFIQDKIKVLEAYEIVDGESSKSIVNYMNGFKLNRND